jgi:hypothetical protein
MELPAASLTASLNMGAANHRAQDCPGNYRLSGSKGKTSGLQNPPGIVVNEAEPVACQLPPV